MQTFSIQFRRKATGSIVRGDFTGLSLETSIRNARDASGMTEEEWEVLSCTPATNTQTSASGTLDNALSAHGRFSKGAIGWFLAAAVLTLAALLLSLLGFRFDVASLAGWMIGGAFSPEYIVPAAIACWTVKDSRGVFVAILIGVGLMVMLRFVLPGFGGHHPWSLFLATKTLSFAIPIWIAFGAKKSRQVRR